MKHVIALVAIMVSAWHASPLCAQTATASEWFDRAAQQFVQQDKITAMRTLDQGLREHPNDPRLTKLAEALLKEDKQQQQEQQQQGGNNDQQKQQQQQSQQQAQEQRSQEQQQQRTEQQQANAGQENRKAGQMDPRDAKRLLDALQRGEKDVQQKVRLRQRPAQRVTIDKDW